MAMLLDPVAVVEITSFIPRPLIPDTKLFIEQSLYVPLRIFATMATSRHGLFLLVSGHHIFNKLIVHIHMKKRQDNKEQYGLLCPL